MRNFISIALVVALSASSSFAWTVPTPSVLSTRSSASASALKAGFFEDIFKPKSKPSVPQYEPVTIKNDFRVAGLFLASGLLLDQIPYIQLTLGPIVTLLGVLFLVQSFRIRFRFNENNEMEIINIETSASGENIVVGGANVWACDAIVNYDFFPPIGSSPIGPILVYFKETQTDSSTWEQGPGKMANKEEKIQAGEAVPGQVHFFPAVCNAEQIRDEFVKRQCQKL